jgi:hypothetical protein
MRVTMMLALLAMAAGANAATLEFDGAAEPFLPGTVNKPGKQALQATVHPTERVVLFGCSDCVTKYGTDIFISTDRGGGHTGGSRAPMSRPGNESLPSFSSDGNWLYFVSDRKGGFGGSDLLRVHFTAYRGAFGPPELLQGTINSDGEEGGIAANAHGADVVFASKGRKGAKGWDLFRSRVHGGRMAEGERLAGIDTAADEFDPALLANDAGIVFARSEAIDTQPASLWFAPRQGDGYGKPVKLGAAVNAPGSSVRGAQQDWSSPGHLLFTRNGEVFRIAYRVAE